MNPLHANYGKECFQCVLDWYRLGSSEDEQDDEVEESAPESPPPTTIVPDSLDLKYLGSQVEETEFDDGYVCLRKSPENDDRPKSPDICPVVEAGCGSAEPESPCTKYLNAYLKRMFDKRPKTPEKKSGLVEYLEFDSSSPSSKRFKAYMDKFCAKR